MGTPQFNNTNIKAISNPWSTAYFFSSSILHITLNMQKNKCIKINGIVSEKCHNGIWPLLRAIYCNYIQAWYSGQKALECLPECRTSVDTGLQEKGIHYVPWWASSTREDSFYPFPLHTTLGRQKWTKPSPILWILHTVGGRGNKHIPYKKSNSTLEGDKWKEKIEQKAEHWQKWDVVSMESSGWPLLKGERWARTRRNELGKMTRIHQERQEPAEQS